MTLYHEGNITNRDNSVAGILFFVLLFRFLAQLPNNQGSPALKGQEFMDILIVAVTVIVVAIPGTCLFIHP
jgi:Ca2+-transporting ATPase